jgi:hypothetical protein
MTQKKSGDFLQILRARYLISLNVTILQGYLKEKCLTLKRFYSVVFSSSWQAVMMKLILFVVMLENLRKKTVSRNIMQSAL